MTVRKRIYDTFGVYFFTCPYAETAKSSSRDRSGERGMMDAEMEKSLFRLDS